MQISCLESWSVMDESMLEWYFDNFIVNDSLKIKEEVEVREEPSEEPSEEPIHQLDEKRIIQEILSQDFSVDTKPTDTASTSLDYNSQNSSAAAIVDPSTPKSEVFPTIQNVVSTVKLGCQLDLRAIASKVWNVKYDPKSFQALIMMIRKPRATALLYKTGNMVCTGTQSEESSYIAARRVARIVQKLGNPVRFLNFKIQTMVGTAKIFPVTLEKLALAHRMHCSYEPELFPALFYKVMPGISVTVFSSGRTSVNGGKTRADICKAFDIIYPILCCFRKLEH